MNVYVNCNKHANFLFCLVFSISERIFILLRGEFLREIDFGGF